MKCCFIGAGATLGIVDHSRRRFARFKLCTHFLKTRGQGLNLPFLQSDHCRLSFSCGLQFLHNALLFEQLICRQRRPRGGNAKLTACGYNNRRARNHCSINASDKSSGLRSCRADANCVGLASKSSIVNINIVAARGQVLTGCKAHRDVVVASCIGLKRSGAGGCIVRASCVAKERSRTVGCIVGADVIAKKRLKPICRVETARCVAIERPITACCIFDAGCVAKQCISTVRQR